MEKEISPHTQTHTRTRAHFAGFEGGGGHGGTGGAGKTSCKAEEEGEAAGSDDEGICRSSSEKESEGGIVIAAIT